MTMKKYSFAFMLLALTWCFKTQAQRPEMVVGAYVTSWTDEVPDPNVMTHINYAFGHVNDTFDGVRIDNPERLRMIVGLKQQHPKLKVLLSIGGWGSGRFSEMAASNENRAKFAQDCQRVVEEYGLDGIDIDWEYPTQSMANISSSPDDTANFTLLMDDLRKAIGGEKLLTAATVCDAQYIDFKACIGFLDLVNVMAYDMNDGDKTHHAALYPSEISGNCTSSQAVEAHLKVGVPAEKLVLGVPFYGKGNREDEGVKAFLKTRTLPEGYERRWSEESQVPYIVDAEGRFVFGDENVKSLSAKCQYILDHHLRGGMYWDYHSDNDEHAFSQTLKRMLIQQ
jgi:GH18 family chitinase